VRRLFTPTLQMTVGLLSMMLSLIFIACSIGLIPNANEAALEARQRAAESLAVQLASLVTRNDIAGINDTITSVVGRNGDVLSIAVRGADGKTTVASANHDAVWDDPLDSKSTPTHIQIPLLSNDVPQGRIEIAFRPLDGQANVLGLSPPMPAFIAFICIGGFIGFFLILSRTLRELDPGHAIPERVKTAFDTLVEGVLILDEGERVLLANNAFAERICSGPELSAGIKASEVFWIDEAATGEFPWQAALRQQERIVGMPLDMRDNSGVVHKLLVNASPILDDKGNTRGVIATFDDVTLLHRTNEQLHLSIAELTRSQQKISEQNRQLEVLASTDPLTKCLNRRTFFSKAEAAFRIAREQRQPMSFLMLDVDHFKKINDRFGHAVGDKVLVGLVDLLQRTCRTHDLVGRYGGEEFCIAVAGFADDDVEGLAEQIRLAVSEVTTWLPDAERVTISIGIASIFDDATLELDGVVKRADEALYAAKKSGRNRFVNRKKMPVLPEAPEAGPVSRQPRAEAIGSRPAASVSPRNPASDYIEALIADDHGELRFAVVLIDLDRLRHFNSFYSRDAGNALLVKLEERIAKGLRRRDMLVHFHGDDFLLLLDPCGVPEETQAIVDEVLAELREPLFVSEDELSSSCSMGISVYPEHGRDYETLRRHADLALYRAKQQGQGRAIFFSMDMLEALALRRAEEQQLRHAIRSGKLCCAFQPKVDIVSRRVVGFEALVRCRNDDGSIRPPSDFIGLAVELGLISDITTFVREAVVKSFDRLDAVFGSETTVSINIASGLANEVQFMKGLATDLKQCGYADRMMLELTEESFIEGGAFQAELISGFREIGVRVSIDDFGTGYSSLSTLAEITADEIKVDRSLISGIHQRPRNQSILRAIKSLGSALNMTIVAEGVETCEELAYLHAVVGIRFVQGHYFCKPFFLEELSGATSLLAEMAPISASPIRTQSPALATA
jgi:diguanylate cyclase (GGDEF)-like protein/PAS domain S-box-containing protein